MKKPMGRFFVPAQITGPTGRSTDVELFVDTGATFLTLPRAMADRLELRSRRACQVEIAGGQTVSWPLADAWLSLQGVETVTLCLIAPKGPALLGAVALESLLVAVDPVQQRLVPVRGFVLSAAFAVCSPPHPHQTSPARARL